MKREWSIKKVSYSNFNVVHPTGCEIRQNQGVMTRERALIIANALNKDPFDGELELLLNDPSFQRQCKDLDDMFEDEIRGEIADILHPRGHYDVRVIDDLKKLIMKLLHTKSKTEEIQYLGQILSATTAEDNDRIKSIIKRLEEINENNH